MLSWICSSLSKSFMSSCFCSSLHEFAPELSNSTPSISSIVTSWVLQGLVLSVIISFLQSASKSGSSIMTSWLQVSCFGFSACRRASSSRSRCLSASSSASRFASSSACWRASSSAMRRPVISSVIFFISSKSFSISSSEQVLFRFCAPSSTSQLAISWSCVSLIALMKSLVRWLGRVAVFVQISVAKVLDELLSESALEATITAATMNSDFFIIIKLR